MKIVILEMDGPKNDSHKKNPTQNAEAADESWLQKTPKNHFFEQRRKADRKKPTCFWKTKIRSDLRRCPGLKVVHNQIETVTKVFTKADEHADPKRDADDKSKALALVIQEYTT